MRQYTTVELARFIEHDIHHNLSMQREGQGASFRFMPVFEVYRRVADNEYGSQITAGFFSKILSDMRKTGIVVAQDGGKSIALSEEAWKVQDGFDTLREKFENLVGDLIERSIFKDGEAVARYLQRTIPLGVEIRFYDGPAEIVDPDLNLPIIQDRFLDLALTYLNAAKRKAESTEGAK